MNEQDLEKRLSRLRLGQPSAHFVSKGLDAIQAGQTLPFWRRYLPLALTAALVFSVSANVFQLVHNKQQVDALEAEQLAQCNTPEVAVFPPAENSPALPFAPQVHPLQPQGMC